jgi:dipeptidyl aminopeptidase/acylaminoacyl peptidase
VTALAASATSTTVATLHAQANTLPYLDRLPPLVERDVFIGDPEIAYAALSPDGRFVAFVKQLDGILNVWVKGIDEPFDAARPVTADTSRPVINYFWSADGKYILYAQDQAGNENFRIYAVDPTAPVPAGGRTPPARDLTPYDSVQARIIAVPKNSPDHILVGLNDRDLRLHDVYRLDLRTAQRELVLRNRESFNVAGWMADLTGNLRLGVRVTADGGTEILRVDRDSLVSIYTCAAAETCSPIQFHKDGRRLYLATNRGDVDLARLVLLDPQTGAEELVESDPEGKVDFGQAIFSNATDELIATSYTGEHERLYPRDSQFRIDLQVIRQALPQGDLFFRVPTRDDRIWIVKEVLDTDEGPNYIYDRAAGTVKLLYRPNPSIPVESMARMMPVTYAARDGELVPAYLTLPKRVTPNNLAVVIMPHGGPWGRDAWGFNAVAQFLANRGYAVLQPNFRSSDGYGKRFLRLGDRTWGTGAMQHDITDGARWLIDQGIADSTRVAIMGGSYGGYATLAGVTFTPDLYAAGVDIVGPSSIITLLQSIPPYWEPLRRIWAVRVGDLNDSADVARMRSQSPLHFADQIKAPLLIVQGANDPRVKRAESDQIVAALRERGRTVEYLVAADEGHGFAGELNNLAMYAAIERFLARHLGGRFQEEMSPEVTERHRVLTVDIRTVSSRE